MPPDPTTPPSDRDQRLLERLRELAHEHDPVPEHVTAAMRAALAARKHPDRQRTHPEPPERPRSPQT